MTRWRLRRRVPGEEANGRAQDAASGGRSAPPSGFVRRLVRAAQVCDGCHVHLNCHTGDTYQRYLF